MKNNSNSNHLHILTEATKVVESTKTECPQPKLPLQQVQQQQQQVLAMQNSCLHQCKEVKPKSLVGAGDLPVKNILPSLPKISYALPFPFPPFPPSTPFQQYMLAPPPSSTLKVPVATQNLSIPRFISGTSPVRSGVSGTEGPAKVEGKLSNSTIVTPTTSTTSTPSTRKRKVHPTPDTKMNGSGQSQEIDDKKRRRLVRNREAAQASRERKKKYVTDLENEVQCLKKRVHDLERENEMLKSTIQSFTGGSETIQPAPLHERDSSPVHHQEEQEVEGGRVGTVASVTNKTRPIAPQEHSAVTSV